MKEYKVVCKDKIDVNGVHHGPAVLCHEPGFGPVLLPRKTSEKRASVMNEAIAPRYAKFFKCELELVREVPGVVPVYSDEQFPKWLNK